MSNVKLKIEIPEVTASDIAALLEGKVTAISHDGYVECVLPWIEGKGEVVVRLANFPLQLNDEAIYVRDLKDMRKITSVLPGSGIARLLREFEASEILSDLEGRLHSIRERLQK